jgi:iron uptake system component EfeO
MSSRPVYALLTAAALTTALAACSSSGHHGGGATKTSGAAGGNARVVAVSITAAKGCELDRTTFRAGGITFKIANKDATAVSEAELLDGERIVGEKENLPPGFSGEFAVSVPAGTYKVYCPGAAKEYTDIKVTGTSANSDAGTAAQLKAASTQYAAYVDTQIAGLVVATKQFVATLSGTNLVAAQNAYMKARPYYERIEPVAESFVIGKDSIDADIDARANDVPATQWRGFHRIEQILFQGKTLKGAAPYGAKLMSDVHRLQGLTKGLTYKPTELANGAQELLDEVAKTKITGEEERYSHIDLLDFANNDEGAEQAFAQLQPVLAKMDAVLAKQIAVQFQALDTLVDTYRTTANASGFKLYNQLTSADKRALAAAVNAVTAPLSSVASKVANA